MTCPELIDVMATKDLWTSPGGKTPANTLYAAISRDIKLNGTGSAFRKVDRYYISLLEHNKKSPTLEMLFRLSNAMGVKASVIVAKVEQTQKS